MLGRDDAFGWFFRLAPIGGIIIFAAALWLQRAPPAAPASDLVHGCYEAADAPAIRIDDAGIHVLQSGTPPIGFRLKRLKQGLALVASIEAMPGPSSYRLVHRGTGRFMPLYREQAGKAFGVFGTDYDGFHLLASDGVQLSYALVAQARCTGPA